MAGVILDAGHGGYDNGAQFNGRREKDDTLRLTLAVGQALRDRGVPVQYTRQTDVYQSPIEKARIGNESGADYFVSYTEIQARFPTHTAEWRLSFTMTVVSRPRWPGM